MRLVSYTRSASWKTEDIPADIIKQQNDCIRKYAKAHGWKILKTYSDRKQDKNEESAFREMLNDGMERQFDAVIVAAIDRAGKSLWSAREVLLQTFHMAGIGFIVVEDDFISMGKDNMAVEDYFQNKSTDQHLEAVRLGMEKKREKGCLHWSDVKYGYKLTDDQQMAVDETTAVIVKRIFSLCAEGKSLRETAAILEREKVLTPRAIKGNHVLVNGPYHWTDSGVKCILRNTAYIGYWYKTVRGEKILYHNEPLVSEELFYKAQETIKKVPSRKGKTIRPPHPFIKLIADSEKGACLGYCISRKTGEAYFHYTELKYRNPLCTKSRISYVEVEETVRKALMAEKEAAGAALKHLLQFGEIQKEAKFGELRDTLLEQSMIMAKMQKEYTAVTIKGDENGEGVSSIHRMEFFKTVDETEELFSTMEEEMERLEIAYSEDNPWLKLYLSYDDGAELTNDYLKKYIGKVYVDRLETVKVQMKEENWKQILIKEMGE